MRLRHGWVAALAAGALLVGGCAAESSGAAERGSSVENAPTSMTQSSVRAPTAEDAEVDVATSDAADTSVAPSADTPSGTSLAAGTTDGAKAAGGATTAGAADCATTTRWTADEKSIPVTAYSVVRSVRGEASNCSESVVIGLDPAATAPGYRVSYVPQVVQDGSGFPVPLRGGAFLEVVVQSPAYDVNSGEATLTLPSKDEAISIADAGFSVIRQVAFAGSFEGQTTFGIGVTKELPFTVTSGVNGDGNTTLTVTIALG